MSTALSAASVAILLVIALELLVLIRELAHPRRPGASDDKMEGQTINVNVAALPAQEAKSATPGAVAVETAVASAVPKAEAAKAPSADEASGEATAQNELSPEPSPDNPSEQAPTPPPRRVVAVPVVGRWQVSTSGQIVVKCPHCKAENSNFRSECFNCGEKL